MPQSMWQYAKRLGTEQTTETTAEIQQKHPFSQTKFLEKMFFFVSEDSENQKDVFFLFQMTAKTNGRLARPASEHQSAKNWHLERYLSL